MHGPTECDLNRLQNCAISTLRNESLLKLIECATTQTGELLNYYSMVNTHRAGVRIWPTMYVNGIFFDRSYPVENKLCEQTAWC
ncbi:unnamed protein product [Strongylus vulgaris]|uniref:Thioredoxin-like fold domain-containing protein n=1 Tax=Strongylus vulgaris TaxID=40348 RepID=A0A3P7L9N1_STRVU|nr:unnamed protein product [Strongylus vulgaris]